MKERKGKEKKSISMQMEFNSMGIGQITEVEKKDMKTVDNIYIQRLVGGVASKRYWKGDASEI